MTNTDILNVLVALKLVRRDSIIEVTTFTGSCSLEATNTRFIKLFPNFKNHEGMKGRVWYIKQQLSNPFASSDKILTHLRCTD